MAESGAQSLFDKVREQSRAATQVAAEEHADETGNIAATPSVCVESRDGLTIEHGPPLSEPYLA